MHELESSLPERFNAAGHLLALNAGRGDKTAYIDDAHVLSYADLAERARHFAGALLALGIRREERVLMAMLDSIDFPIAFLGALYAGIVPVPVNTLLTADDYAFMIANSRAQAVLASHALLSTLGPALSAAQTAPHLIVSGNGNGNGELAAGAIPFAQLLTGPQLTEPADTRGDDFAFWLYSSGSTGRPKATVHSHANLYWTAQLYGTPVLGLRESDVAFSAAKLFFAYGLGNALTFPLSVGATTVLMAERPTPAAIFKRWMAHRVTVFFGAPTGYAGMLAAPDLPARADTRLRLCSSAGEALPREIGERFEAHFGCEIVDGLGSTEMLHIFLSNRPGAVRYGTSGVAVPGYRLRLFNESGLEAPAGEIGDLHVSGPSSAWMYWGQREKSRATFHGEWTKTGDKYLIDADGRYVYAGRSDDMLKVSGVYVSPFEIEGTLMRHAAVLECAVIGVADADGLTKTKAFVVCKAGHAVSEAELKAFVKEKLAPYKYPRMIEFLPELPKTATGKIQRFKLRDIERNRLAGMASAYSPASALTP